MTLRSRHKIADMFRCFCILLTLFFGMAAIIGSGGGGGGGGGGSDTTAPEIVSTSPADSATGIAIASAISATFSEDMDAATITTASFSIDNSVTGSVSYSAGTHTATFTPSVNLSPDTTYTVTISASCTDAAGNALAADYSWTFTTGGAAVAVWSSVGGPVSPAGNEHESEDPTLMIVNGQPTVGYRQASFQANLNTWDGTSWGTSVTDPTDDNMNYTGYRAPAYCSNGTGAYLAYSLAGVSGGTDEEFYDRVFVRTWTGGSTWSAPLNNGQEVSDATTNPYGANAFEPDIHCGSAGSLWVAWIENNVAGITNDDDLWLAQVTDTSAVRSTPLSRNASGTFGTDVESAAVISDGAGTVYAAFWEAHLTEAFRSNLFVSSYSSGAFTSLGGSLADDYDSNNLSKPSLAFLDSDLYVAYTTANNSDTTHYVYVQKYHDGSWSTVGGGPVSAFSATDHYDSGHPVLKAANGNLYLAWDETDQYEGPFVYVARLLSAEDTWEIVGNKLNVDQDRAAQDPSLAYDASAPALYVAFEEYVDGYPQIFVKKMNLTP